MKDEATVHTAKVTEQWCSDSFFTSMYPNILEKITTTYFGNHQPSEVAIRGKGNNASWYCLIFFGKIICVLIVRYISVFP